MADQAKPNVPPGGSKPKYVNLVTPKCELQYLNLNKKDKQFGKYGVVMIFDETIPEHKAFIEKVQKLSKECYEEQVKTLTKKRSEYRAKSLPVPIEDANGNPTGKYKMNSSTNNPVPCYDGAKAPLNDAEITRLWSGTKGRVALSLKGGINQNRMQIGFVVYTQSVQILEPVFAGSNAGKECPFEEVEGSYESSGEGTPGASEAPPDADPEAGNF